MCHCLFVWQASSVEEHCFFKIGFLHNLTNKMNVCVWALTFFNLKKGMCAPLFIDVCVFFLQEKKMFFGTFMCFKVWVLKVNRTLSGFLFFFVYYVLFFCMSIALDNQLRQKDKKKMCKGPRNSLVSPQLIYLVGCLMYVHLSDKIWYCSWFLMINAS